MAANNYVDRKGELAREYGFQNSYKYGDPYLDSLLEKSDDKLEGYDKAMLNVNPDLKAKRDAYQKSLARSSKLQSDLTNIQTAQQFLQNNVSQQKERINKLYDLQDKAAAISASIQGTNRVAGGLGAASNVLSNGRGVTEATKHQQILQNDAQRESALANVSQQEANIPSVLASLQQNEASIDQANANAELARAQAKYYTSQANKSYSYNSSKKTKTDPKELEDGTTFGPDGSFTYKGGKIYDAGGNEVGSGVLRKSGDFLIDADNTIVGYKDSINSQWKGFNTNQVGTGN